MTGPPVRRDLFFYGEDGGLVDRAAPLLVDGLAQREAVVLVVDARKRALMVGQLACIRSRQLLHAPRGRARGRARTPAPGSGLEAGRTVAG